MPKKSGGTAVATRKEEQAVLATLADLATKSTGLEGLGSEDYALPFLKLAQGLTPEVQDKNTSVSAGDIFDSVSLEGADNVLVIPCAVRRSVIEWAPRNQGGGFRGEYSSWAAARENAEEDSDLKDTFNYTVLYSLDGGDTFQPARLSMKSTQVKVARKWNTHLAQLRVPFDGRRIQPPMFGTLWILGTVQQSNQHGTFYNFTITPNDPILVTSADLLAQAQHLNSISDRVMSQPQDAEVVDEDAGDGADF